MLHRLTRALPLGLRTDDTVYHCTKCEKDFCTSCQRPHAALHASDLVRASYQGWSQGMMTLAEFVNCPDCSLEVRCRVQCLGCPQAICWECYEDATRRSNWYQHQTQHGKGKGVVFLVTPNHSVVPLSDHICDCLVASGCAGHCSECFGCKSLQYPSCEKIRLHGSISLNRARSKPCMCEISQKFHRITSQPRAAVIALFDAYCL